MICNEIGNTDRSLTPLYLIRNLKRLNLCDDHMYCWPDFIAQRMKVSSYVSEYRSW